MAGDVFDPSCLFVCFSKTTHTSGTDFRESCWRNKQWTSDGSIDFFENGMGHIPSVYNIVVNMTLRRPGFALNGGHCRSGCTGATARLQRFAFYFTVIGINPRPSVGRNEMALTWVISAGLYIYRRLEARSICCYSGSLISATVVVARRRKSDNYASLLLIQSSLKRKVITCSHFTQPYAKTAYACLFLLKK